MQEKTSSREPFVSHLRSNGSVHWMAEEKKNKNFIHLADWLILFLVQDIRDDRLCSMYIQYLKSYLCITTREQDVAHSRSALRRRLNE